MTQLLLAIDTSIFGLRMGLVEMGKFSPIWSATVDDAKGSAAKMASLLAEGFNVAGGDVAHLTKVAVSCGPGSFTGIRVGIAFAKGLVAGRTADVVGCSSIGLYAAAESIRCGSMVSIFLPATSTAGYWLRAEHGRVLDARGVDCAGVGKLRADSVADSKQVIVGKWPAMSEALGQIGSSCEDRALTDVADSACLEMCKVFSSADISWQKMPLEPLYLRKSSVEEKKGTENGQ